MTHYVYEKVIFTQSFLYNLINNKTISVRFDTLDKLSKALNVPIGDLFQELPDDESEYKDGYDVN
ncbi:MAG: helix-turn-helix transcriptional regulator [Lachnospiraceae bacterium]|nr:helix-turn-helix transcriptional regulator [Lachnospiraceae bacterium]